MNKVINYCKAMVLVEKRPRVTNTKGLIRLWVPKYDFMFADMIELVYLT